MFLNNTLLLLLLLLLLVLRLIYNLADGSSGAVVEHQVDNQKNMSSRPISATLQILFNHRKIIGNLRQTSENLRTIPMKSENFSFINGLIRPRNEKHFPIY